MLKRTTASMTFRQHIEEFRRRIIVAALFVTAGSAAGYVLFPWFMDAVRQVIGENLYAFGIAEGFLTRLKIALSIGLFLSLPVVIMEIVLFILPALKTREKRTLVVFLITGYVLFLGGVAFAFKGVLPYAVAFLTSAEFFPENVGRLISFRQFLDFFMTFLLGFGACFQFPIVMLLILKFNVLPLRFFTKNFKYMIIVILIVAAVITPPDVVSQVALAVPLLALYCLTLVIAKLTGLGKNRPAGPREEH
jgi:sec-independent protein translocase protein TatC